jgi:hypothetical protein
LRLRKMPRPAKANRAFLLQLSHDQHIKFVERQLSVFLANPDLLGQMAHYLRLCHPLPLHQPIIERPKAVQAERNPGRIQMIGE